MAHSGSFMRNSVALLNVKAIGEKGKTTSLQFKDFGFTAEIPTALKQS
jgi:hypothetical protein